MRFARNYIKYLNHRRHTKANIKHPAFIEYLSHLTLAVSFYEVYSDTHIHEHNSHAFTCSRKSDEKEFFVKRVHQNSREPEFVKMCQSPYTVRFQEYIPPYMVLENLPGGDLLSFINTNTLETIEVLVLLKDMLAALAVVHANGLVHSDCKAENFVFAESDCAIDPATEGNIRLADFGSAREASDRESELTGTLAYIAPEVVEGLVGVSHKSDIYAIGCIGFLLLTGDPLIDPSLPDEDIVERIRDPDFPENRFKGNRGDVAVFVRKLVARDPRDRPTAQEALEEVVVLINAN